MSESTHTHPFSQNAELISKAQGGDKEAMAQAVELNMGLVKSIVPRFADRGTEYEDLLQIGTMGMIKAIRSFDSSYNTVFSTYAVPLIIGEIRRFLRDDGLIKVSRNTKRLAVSAMKEKEKFIQKNNREPSICELCELCECTHEELITSLESAVPPRSLSEPVGDDEGLTLEGILPEQNDVIDSLCDSLALKEALSKLEVRQRKIIFLRYFKNMSQQQCAEQLGLTQVKISREEKKIFEKLRAELIR